MNIRIEQKSELSEKELFKLEEYDKKIFGDGSLNRYHFPVVARYGNLFILYADNEIAALAIFIKNSNTAFLLGLWVLEEHRNKGFAKKLLSKTLKELRGQGFKAVELTVEEKNSIALNVYNQLGFKKITNLRDFYGPNESRLLLRRNLI